MNYKTLSWNVRGLSLPHRKAEVQKTIVKWKPDIMFLQEVKVSGPRLVASLFNIWREGTVFHTSHNEGSGGVVIGLAS